MAILANGEDMSKYTDEEIQALVDVATAYATAYETANLHTGSAMHKALEPFRPPKKPRIVHANEIWADGGDIKYIELTPEVIATLKAAGVEVE